MRDDSDNPRVFLDSSVIIAGFGSRKGASNLTLSLCKAKKIQGIITDLVVREVAKNLKKKISQEALNEFYQYLAIDCFKVITLENEEEIIKHCNITESKDAHILAGVKKARVDFLLTLDKKHLLTSKVGNYLKPLKVLTPGDFLKKFKK